MQWTEIKVETWDELVSHFDQLDDDWLFRGQSNARWDLRTSLERHTPANLSGLEAETILLKEFRRRAHTYLPAHHTPAKDASAEWLALMQHFGAPTRLLDVTASPYVATYFAAEDRPEGAEAFAIWAIHGGWCFRAAGEAVSMEDPAAVATLDTLLAKGGTNPEDEDVRQVARGLLLSKLAKDAWRSKKHSVILPFRPDQLSERLSVQQGQFLVPLNVNQPFMNGLNAMATRADAALFVRRFVVPSTPANRGRILERLRQMNMTRAQLFPGLDGFAQSFRQLLIREPEEDKATRLQEWLALQRKRVRASPHPGEEGKK